MCSFVCLPLISLLIFHFLFLIPYSLFLYHPLSLFLFFHFLTVSLIYHIHILLQTEITRLISIAQNLREEIFEKNEKIREISILLDIEESLNLDLNCSINNLKQEMVCIKKENEEILRICDLQTEKDKLLIAFTIEKEKEWEMEKRRNTPIGLPLLTRTGENM